ncbi:MAG: hypothetical protein K940chlam9_00411 [Chlamydiae bacterium]|nr:hypothetical protein [Chlamydiota bacterium]
MESFLIVILFIALVWLYVKLSARVKKCERLLNQLQPTSSNSKEIKKQPTPPPVPPKISKASSRAKKNLSRPLLTRGTIPKNNHRGLSKPLKFFRIPNFVQENWMGVFGSIVLVMGTVFFSLTAKIMHHPQSRVVAMLLFSLILTGISKLLKKNPQWILLCGWLQSVASSVILFAAIGAGGIKGLQFIDSPSLALGFLCVGVATNILLSSVTPSQIVASLHVILCIIAFCTAPQAFILLPMGALVATIGLLNAYRAKWDIHLLLIVTAFAFQNLYFLFRLTSELLPWMYGLAILCSLIVGLTAGLIHYSKKYKSPHFELFPFIAHIANWGFLTFNICLYAKFFRGVPLILASIACAGFILARVAKKRGIVWLFHTDTIFSQLVALAAIISCHAFSTHACDIAILVLIETLVFTLVFQFQKEVFLVRVGNCLQTIASFTTLLCIFLIVLLDPHVHHFALYFRFGIGATLCWGYYLFISWQGLIVDDYRFIYLGKKEPKNPLSIASLFGVLFFISLYAYGFISPVIQSLTFLTLLMIGLRRKTQEDPSSNLTLLIPLVFVHVLNWMQLFYLGFHTEAIPSIFSNCNFLGLFFLDLVLLIGNFLAFKSWRKNYTPLLIYGLGIQVLFLAYVFTKQISTLIPGLAFLVFSLLILETARMLPKFLKCDDTAKLQVEKNMIQVGLAALIGFLSQFITVHLQVDPVWHRISLRWIVEISGLSTILFWIIFCPNNFSHRSLTQLLLNRLVEILLGFLSLCIVVEAPESWRPLLWVIVSMGLLLGSLHYSWSKRLYAYSWLYFIASIVHLTFATSSLVMPRIFFFERFHLITLVTIFLQFSYAYYVHKNENKIKERVKSMPFTLNLFRFANLTINLLVFLGVALLLAFLFEKTLLTLLWVGWISVYLSVSLLIKSQRSIQIGMASLLLCSGRLIFFDLVQTDLSTRALVFIGVGSLMLGISILYKKYKHRILSYEKI